MNTVRCVQRISMAMAATCALALAACGGGGGYGGGGIMPPPPPTLTISVAPTSIVLGQSATVTWASSTGSACTASGAWSGTVAASGTKVVTPTAVGTATYTLACAGGGAYGGNVTNSAVLTVTAPSAFSATKLVGDTGAAGAAHTDANLINPWGIAFGPTSPFWVANNHSETSTLYDGNGAAQMLVVSLPPSGAVSFDPTGTVFNGSTDFIVTGTGTGPARFIFVGEGGMLAGWSPVADPNNTIRVYTAVDGAVYKGLAIANNGSGNFLYATDFHNGKVDVFNATFVKQAPSSTSFTFTDPTLPAGYAPFGIQALKTGAAGATQIYVSYAKQGVPPSNDNVNGAGLGLVDIYDTNGQFIKQLIPTGVLLNAPWGIALAPANFGTLSNALLVGNFGDGKINGYDVTSGTYLGTIADSAGSAFAVPGLWAIAFGNDAVNQPHDTLFYAAGTNNEVNGEYGRIDLGASPPVLGTPPGVTVTAPAAGSVSGMVTVTATVTDSIALSRVELFANGTSLTVCTASPCTVTWDTTKVANGSFSLNAVASDVNHNVATSAAVAVTVANVAPAATTLTQLQALIFTPICSVCHTGVGTTLPGVQNLTAGNTFASLVNVTSIKNPALKRVTPGDSVNSFIIQKLEGTQGAANGARMPLNGPYLDQATIDQVKSWINAGALNN